VRCCARLNQPGAIVPSQRNSLDSSTVAAAIATPAAVSAATTSTSRLETVDTESIQGLFVNIKPETRSLWNFNFAISERKRLFSFHS